MSDLRRYQRVSQAQIEKMWAVYRETGTINAVVTALRVHPETVRRWREREGWDARREAILRKSRNQSDARYAVWLEEQRVAVDSMIERAKRRLLPEAIRDAMGKDIEPPMDITIQDTIALMKFGLFLRGGPETRQESVPGASADAGAEEESTITKKVLQALDADTKRNLIKVLRAQRGASRHGNGAGPNRPVRAPRHQREDAPEGAGQ